MYYISQEIVAYALSILANVDPFFGITYLTCKKNKLPIDEGVNFEIGKAETEYLKEFFKPIPESTYFFRVFRVSEQGTRYWLPNYYPSKGSQRTRTNSKFSQAFIHPKGSNIWGWKKDYAIVLSKYLNRKISIYCLAAWIYRERLWESIDKQNIINTFIREFNISEIEIDVLFDTSIPDDVIGLYHFDTKPFNWNFIKDIFHIPLPPDVPAEKGGALSYLSLKGIGPSKSLSLALAERLNIITGDNGLGKTFILECAWWALTESWTGQVVYPRTDSLANEPEISYKISGSYNNSDIVTAGFNRRMQQWYTNKKRETIPGLVLYARNDGAFAVWDPLRVVKISNRYNDNNLIPPIIFTKQDVWDGLKFNNSFGTFHTSYICNGLIKDWVNWQISGNEIFDVLKEVLKRLSPPDTSKGDLGILEPGDPIRIMGEAGTIPTIKHPYGEVPIIFASAAVQRIVALAYLIVWTWEEHKINSENIREPLQTKMVILADEIEAHLHPQWQRVILPALVSIATTLHKNLEIQFIFTTHSPLVLTSIEPIFSNEDKLFHLNLNKNDLKEVILENIVFERRGTVDSWLTSPVFELTSPRNIEAEKVLETAKKILISKNPSEEHILEISNKLLKYLQPHDTFWIRWRFFAESFGVKL